MKKLIIAGVIVISVFLVFNSMSSSGLHKAANMANSSDDQVVGFVVNQGENVKQVANSLKEADLIRSSSVFSRYAKKLDVDDKIRAGSYSLNKNMTIHAILTVLVSGDREETWLTIPEGWRIDQIASYIEKEGLVRAKDFENRAKVKNFSSYSFLSGLSGNTTLEGYLFPDTYRVFTDSSADEIIEKMLSNFVSKVTSDTIDKAKSMGFSLHEFITLTSIIEKESAHNIDIGKIASVYYNRLRDGMHLQSDATITYITKRPDARPTFDETRVNSPYNTYLNPGLPPGPIGNPGMAAIEATLNPDDTPYYFFVSRGDRAYFATTYEEHLINISLYLDS